MKNVSESLTGLVGVLKLQGFSQSEKAGFDYARYIRTYIERDIRELINVSNEIDL